jgi:hypothetical protein
MRFFLPVSAMFAFLFAAAAQAAEINYDYAQLDMILSGDFELEGANQLDYDGFGVDVSARFGDPVFGFAGSSSRTVEFSSRDVSSDLFYAGVGVRHGLDVGPRSALDIYGTLSHERYGMLDTSGSGGYGIGGGMRWMPAAGLELAAGLRHVDYGSMDLSSTREFDLDGLRYRLGVLFRVTDQASLGINYRVGDLQGQPDIGPSFDVEEDEIRFGGRWHY